MTETPTTPTLTTTVLNRSLAAAVERLRGTCPVRLLLDVPVAGPWLAANLPRTYHPADVLAAALSENGHPISGRAIQAHRDNTCPCVIPEGG